MSALAQLPVLFGKAAQKQRQQLAGQAQEQPQPQPAAKRVRAAVERYNPDQSDDYKDAETLSADSQDAPVMWAIHTCLAGNNPLPIVKIFEDQYIGRVKSFGVGNAAWQHAIALAAAKSIWTIQPLNRPSFTATCFFCRSVKVLTVSVAGNVTYGHAGACCAKRFTFLSHAMNLLSTILERQGVDAIAFAEVEEEWEPLITVLDKHLVALEHV